jgi:putative tricarboxylic transport membrane protein
MSTSQSRLPGELGFMVLCVAFSTFMLWASYSISRFDSISSPGAFPMVCAATMLVTGFISLRQSARAKVQVEGGESLVQQFIRRLMPLQLVFLVALIVAYMVALELLGFIVSSYIFLFVAMRLLGSPRMGLNLLVSALVLGAIYVVFQTAFSVVLPSGSLISPYLPESMK